MLKGLNEYSNQKFDDAFKSRIIFSIVYVYKHSMHWRDTMKIRNAFSDIIDDLTWDKKKILIKEFYKSLLRPYYRRVKDIFSSKNILGAQ